MKALQLIDTNNTQDAYHNTVYCWDTVHGVRAFSFTAFLDKFLTPAHSDNIEFRRVSDTSSRTSLEAADLMYVQFHTSERDNRNIHVQMAFRTIWHAVTKEVLEIGDDKSV